MSESETTAYRSTTPFDAERIGAVAVYCSDGRFGEAFDDFLHTGLGLPRYDRLALPGGAACLAGHFAAWRAEEAAVGHLQFLIEVHRLQQVVLIAHEDCAFYTQILRAAPIRLREKQCEDLEKAAKRVLELNRKLVVRSYLARLDGATVAFEEA
ncbi:MAG: carbonic anhydrase [Planctomycetota bacterium]